VLQHIIIRNYRKLIHHTGACIKIGLNTIPTPMSDRTPAFGPGPCGRIVLIASRSQRPPINAEPLEQGPSGRTLFSCRDIHIFHYTCIFTSLLSHSDIHISLYTCISVHFDHHGCNMSHVKSGLYGLAHILCLVKSDPYGLAHISCLVKKRPGMGWLILLATFHDLYSHPCLVTGRLGHRYSMRAFRIFS
jgi:hypothetical protein